MKGWRKVGERTLHIRSDAERAADGLFLVGYRVKTRPQSAAIAGGVVLVPASWRVIWYERETVSA